MTTKPIPTPGWRHANDVSHLLRHSTPTSISPHDCYHIAFLLRQRVDADVVPMILDLAGFHAQHIARVVKKVSVESNMAPLTYLITTPIECPVRVQHPVLAVRFNVTGHDQGWVSDPSQGNWTWFTAGVLRGPREDAIRYGGEVREEGAIVSVVQTVDSQDLQDPFYRRYGCRSVSDVPAPADASEDDDAGFLLGEADACADAERRDYRYLQCEREVCRNRIANSGYETHCVEWRGDGEDEEQRDWVRGLRNGDRIVVRVWAQFPGWRNYVSKVEVVVETRMMA